jgi:Flp pilus assembly pilin Flp
MWFDIMQQLFARMWHEEDGVLSFEWTLVVTLVVIGIVAGLSAARDAIIDELGDAAQAMLALDGSFTIGQPLAVSIDGDGAGPAAAADVGGASDSGFTDRATYSDCQRESLPGQGALADGGS